jgi:hypothetical protein
LELYFEPLNTCVLHSELTFYDVEKNHPYFSEIANAKKAGWIKGGYEKIDQYDYIPHFYPNRKLSRAELLKIALEAAIQSKLYTVDNVNKFENAECFSDVNVDKLGDLTKYVCFAKEQGFVSGYDDGSFKPNEKVTLGGSLKITMTIFGFNDRCVPDNPIPVFDADWQPYLDTAQKLGIIVKLSPLCHHKGLVFKAQAMRLIPNTASLLTVIIWPYGLSNNVFKPLLA